MATLADLDAFIDDVLADAPRYRPVLREVRELFEALEKGRRAKVKRLRAKYRSWQELDLAFEETRAAAARDAKLRRVLGAIGDVALTVARAAAVSAL